MNSIVPVIITSVILIIITSIISTNFIGTIPT